MTAARATVALGGLSGDFGRAVLAVITAIALGFALGTGRGVFAAALLVVAVAVALGIASWRYSTYALLLYIPVSGVPIIATYPNTEVAVLLKDFLFVIPAYLGFLAWASARRQTLSFPGAPVVLLALLALLVLIQALNPSLPNLLVGAIGVKVWLLYIPLYFLGYHLVRSRLELSTLLAVISLSAVLPLSLGIVEALLIKSGHASQVYGWYGAAASAATQDFAQFDYEGGGTLRRVPSTFSFVTQYYLFTATMVVVTYAWWRGALVGTKSAVLGSALWLLAIAASFLSGARGAFLLIPLLVVLIIALDHRRGFQVPVRFLAPIAALLAAVAAFGAAASAVIGAALRTAALEFEDIFLEGVRHAFSTTWLGLGTGIDTSATRYAYSQPETFQGTWHESWWVKVVLELGVPGLVLVCLVFGALLRGGWHNHRGLRDPRLRAVSAALLVFLVWTLAYGLKGQYLDFDPINVYFWFLAGVLARIPLLDMANAREAP